MDNKSSSLGSSFEFYSDYVNKEKALQPEYYSEIEKILDNAIIEFTQINDRKPFLLDIGSAGIVPYNPDLVERALILDLFKKPKELALPEKIDWIVGDFLDVETVNKILEKYPIDGVIVSSVLHHLCDYDNNSLKNLRLFMRHIKMFKCNTYVFESVCPKILAKLQDIVWPIQRFILRDMIKFANVRMLCQKELFDAIHENDLFIKNIPFRQPQHIAQFFFRVPSKFYPLRIIAIKISNDEGEGEFV